MPVNWIELLTSRHVPFVTGGKNVAKGYIAVTCPWCPDDPSQHMAISLSGEGWHCWRNHAHRGRSPIRLIQALLRCSQEEAETLAGYKPVNSDILSRVRTLLSPSPPAEQRIVTMPENFKPIGRSPMARPFRFHLHMKRQYTDEQIDRMTTDYGLRFCTTGPFAGRIIFPVVSDGKLVSWTGRTIYNRQPRYKALTTDPDTAAMQDMPVGNRLTDYLLWQDDLKGETLCLCEGPFDALRVRVLGRDMRITATCFFTAFPSNRQMERLRSLLPKFKHRYILLDNNTLSTSMRVAAKLYCLGVSYKRLPDDVKDPGEIQTVSELLRVLG